MKLHLYIPADRVTDIRNELENDFKIEQEFGTPGPHRGEVDSLFIIETTEEKFTFLLLKYGRDRVWKR